MSAPIELTENKSHKSFLVGLLAAVFAVNVIDVFAPLLYPEIAVAFGITIGTAVQLSAFSALAGVITGLALSAFSIRFRYKSLLTAGVFAIVVCALGVFLAPNFFFAQIFYSLNGVGSVIVAVMAPTLIGELYPLEKKAKTTSLVLATGVLALLVGSPVIGIIADTGEVTSWHSALLWFVFPAALICLLLVIIFVPTKTSKLKRKEPFLNGFKEVFTNRSASACVANGFFAGIFFANNVFAPSFLKDIFSITPTFRSFTLMVSALILVFGVFTGGLLVNSVGRKRLLWGSAIPSVILSVFCYPLSLIIPNVWIVLGFRFVASFIGGFPLVAGQNLALEQVPKFRGTVMSLQNSFNGIGGAIGILISGTILNVISNSIFGYSVAMITLGALGLVGILNIMLFAKDPVKNLQAHNKFS
jgi:predicted MFS family arabinose efflux permease